MPLFKAWSEYKLNKKFVVAENFAELVSKGKRFRFSWKVGDLTLSKALTGGAFDRLNWQQNDEFDQSLTRVNSLFHYLCSQCYAAQHSYVPLLSLRRDSPSQIVPLCDLVAQSAE